MGGIKHQKWVVYHWYTHIIKITQDIHLKNIYHISHLIQHWFTWTQLPVLLVFLSITRRPGPPRSRGCCEWAWSLLEFHGCIRQFHQGRSGEVPVFIWWDGILVMGHTDQPGRHAYLLNQLVKLDVMLTVSMPLFVGMHRGEKVTRGLLPLEDYLSFSVAVFLIGCSLSW